MEPYLSMPRSSLTRSFNETLFSPNKVALD